MNCSLERGGSSKKADCFGGNLKIKKAAFMLLFFIFKKYKKIIF
jgi:hypothetical protein